MGIYDLQMPWETPTGEGINVGYKSGLGQDFSTPPSQTSSNVSNGQLTLGYLMSEQASQSLAPAAIAIAIEQNYGMGALIDWMSDIPSGQQYWASLPVDVQTSQGVGATGANVKMTALGTPIMTNEFGGPGSPLSNLPTDINTDGTPDLSGYQQVGQAGSGGIILQSVNNPEEFILYNPAIGTKVSIGREAAQVEILAYQDRLTGEDTSGQVDRWDRIIQNGQWYNVGYDAQGNVVATNPTGEMYQDPNQITAWQQAQIDMSNTGTADDNAWRQAQLQWDQEQFRLQQEEQQRQYAADLAANPVQWLQHAAYTGQQPVVQPWMLPLQSGDYPSWQSGQPIFGGGVPQQGGVPSQGGGSPITYNPSIQQSAGYNQTGGVASNPEYQAYQAELAALNQQYPVGSPERQALQQSDPQLWGDMRFGPNPYNFGGSQPTTQSYQQPANYNQSGGTGPYGSGGSYDYSQLPQLLNPSAQLQARMGPTAAQQYSGYLQAQTGQSPQETDFRLWSQAPPGGGGNFNVTQWR